MQKIVIILAVTLLLSSCVHKMNVQQGNIIEQDNVKKLYIGMSEDEVINIMGTPILINTFKDNHVDYVYTNKPGYGAGTEKKLTLIFQNNRLKNTSTMTEQQFGH